MSKEYKYKRIQEVLTSKAHYDLIQHWYDQEFKLTAANFTVDNVCVYGGDGLGEVADQIVKDAKEWDEYVDRTSGNHRGSIGNRSGYHAPHKMG